MPIETHIIYPSNKHNRPSPPSRVVLHGLDRIGSPIQIRNHRFFHAPTTKFDQLVDTLQSSLAEALELYPPVAGAIESDQKGDIYSLMGPKFNKGTPFLVEKKSTSYQGDTIDIGPRQDVILPESASVLAVKVTQFSCGTIAVASSFNHQITDLRGTLDFLELWALINRGEPIDVKHIPDDWTHTPGRFFQGLTTASAPKAPSPFLLLDTPALGPPAYLLVPSVATFWKLTSHDMERLKRDLSPPSDPTMTTWISSGDALASLACGAITRAREQTSVPRLQGRSSKEEPYEQVAMAADGRDRAPKNDMAGGHYFGNFNPLWNANISRSDLLDATPESASRVALAIRTALTKELSPEAIGYKISFLEDPTNQQPPGRISWSADLILTNWCKNDIKGPKLDFGWGKPFHATSGRGGSLPPGYCLMTHDYDTGDTTVLMTVEEKGVNELKSDTLLNRYATQTTE
ncbi:bahd family acyltransferase [Mucor ambiguus]|uniref:Bahd family acyltransferase n=1 Tax=Mucor ambiguus TaxID=91626 RepID=A0A0C9M9S2_9FUNG|nr:bahd family acyltransferase [Mucor ambiguus]